MAYIANKLNCLTLECSNYNDINEADRAVENSDQSSVKCDNTLQEGWYRFRGNAGNEMPESCPPKQRCGTHAPGWLNGNHPSVAEGAVQRQVCYHWSSGCCQWQNDIQVRNCSGYYVYRLKSPPACSLRYCVNHQGKKYKLFKKHVILNLVLSPFCND